ncbi:MAG: hypothetical protein QME78_00785 [Thermodesulfobacteriota bacterium]|nr:hypothetical protein [Thermodesulfobacteriota bacterium]
MFRSLFLKISLSVGTVVTRTLAFFAYFIIENQKEHLLSAKSKEVEILSTLIRDGLTNAMKGGQARDVHNFLNLFGIQAGPLEMRLLDQNGKVLRSSQKIEEGISLPHLLPGQIQLEKTPPGFPAGNPQPAFSHVGPDPPQRNDLFPLPRAG